MPGVREREKSVEVFGVLAREYRKVVPLGGHPLLDRLALLILSKDVPAPRALAALERLKKDFVDWNEVRVSPSFEVQRSLEPLEESDTNAKAGRLRMLVGRIFEKRNSLSLEWMLAEGAEARERFLQALEALDAWMIHAFLLSLGEKGEILFEQNMSRVLQRIGVIRRTGSPSKALEGIRDLAPEGEEVSFQALLVRHGEEICGPRVYLCERCRLLPLCRFGKSRK